MAKRVYWDSCTFLGLINQEPGKLNNCAAVWKEAEAGDVLIYTPFFTFAEVFKAKCEDAGKPLSEDGDKQIELLLRQRWIRAVVVDEKIGVACRRLMRHHTECKKPSDGIHLATALALNVDEMHTFDGADLLKLDGKVNRADGKPLKICPPKPTPKPPKPQHDIFEGAQ
ncbi:PIN domain-containing protein [Mesorhizobium sp. M0145]|uniref:type II toxin-antitoxin system VapC family toxin n=1 Tax=unclassified Mesorhizobium TaxID=325217 RepID=UPI00333553E7